ncbi:unnamed protein product [Mytilus edulis]|uniref:Tc1-like transposase DDE domain-containing protein n=2 Tax=Mytilus TaxID=6548 RepID=A0A8S3UIG9_MYTED|nr:unnamed protein product [Mytilus edulis]
MRHTSHDSKLEIIRLYKKSYSNTEIKVSLESQGVSISKQVVSYWVQQFRNGKFDANLSPTKWKKFNKLSRADVRLVSKTLAKKPCTTSRQLYRFLKQRGSKISLTTTKRAIFHAGYTNTKPRYAQMVRHVNKEKRVNFCKTLIAADDQFEDIIFTDECSAQLHNNKVTFYRKITANRPSIPKPKHPLKVHLWAGISKRGATPILIFDGIMTGEFFTNAILKDEALPFINRKFADHHRFQMDNDPKHRSRVSKDFMAANGINWWNDWPSESADLNPIEMVWSQLKRYLAKKTLFTKEDLINSIREFWAVYMTKDQCSGYIDHIFKVVPVCILMKGQATGSMPDKLFRSISSRGRSIGYFNNLLWSPGFEEKRKMCL